MKIGVVYPQTEFGSAPAAIKDYAQTAEALGFAHIHRCHQPLSFINPSGTIQALATSL